VCLCFIMKAGLVKLLTSTSDNSINGCAVQVAASTSRSFLDNVKLSTRQIVVTNFFWIVVDNDKISFGKQKMSRGCSAHHSFYFGPKKIFQFFYQIRFLAIVVKKEKIKKVKNVPHPTKQRSDSSGQDCFVTVSIKEKSHARYIVTCYGIRFIEQEQWVVFDGIQNDVVLILTTTPSSDPSLWKNTITTTTVHVARTRH
jgi:hypothetical protein